MENSSSSTQSLTDLIGVLSESKRIISSHSRHFLALSVLFLLPLSFSLTVFPTLFHSFTSSSHDNHIQSLLRFSASPHFHLHPSLHNPNSRKTIVFVVVFVVFFGVFALLGVSAVTSSVYNGFYGRPVKVLSAIRSGLRLFFPLLGTFFTAQVFIFTLFGIIIGLGVLGAGAVRLVSRIDLLSFDSPYFTWVCLIGAVVLGLSLLYNCVNWTVVSVIVVVEEIWGMKPMYRSRSLMRGMRWVALMLILFFGFFEAGVLWASTVAGLDEYSGFVSSGWSTFGFVLQIVATSAVLTVLLLHSVAATTVLYMYCKALHGELAGEILHEFATEYVCLPFDENKVPHVVCVAN